MSRKQKALQLLTALYLVLLLLFRLLPVTLKEKTALGILMVLGPPIAYFAPLFILVIAAAVLRDRRALAGNAITAFIILFGYMDCRVHVPTSPEPGDIVVVNYNIEGMTEGEDKVCNALLAMNPDVMLLQEASASTVPVLEKALPDWHFLQAKLHPELVIGSRFPLHHPEEFELGARFRTGFTAQAKIKDTEVNLVDVHFSVSLDGGSLSTAGDKAAYLVHTAEVRQIQTKALLARLDAMQGPVWLAGDFNSTPLAYPVQAMRGKLEDAFAESGLGPGLTFNESNRWWRIDYLFKTWDFASVRCDVISAKASDHLAMRSVLRRR